MKRSAEVVDFTQVRQRKLDPYFDTRSKIDWDAIAAKARCEEREFLELTAKIVDFAEERKAS